MRVLILGANGMMGHMASLVMGRRYDVYGSVRRSHADIPGLDRFLPEDRCIEQTNPLDPMALDDLLRAVQPEVVLNCIGVVKQSGLANQAIPSIEINSLFPHQLCRVAEKRDAYVIHLSTDCVFSGERGRYTEDDIPDPPDLYGRSKLLGETSVDEGLTIRTSIVGRELNSAQGLFEWAHARAGQAIAGYPRAVFGGMTTHALSEHLLQYLESGMRLTGTWHVAGPPISKLDLLRLLNQKADLGLDIAVSDEVRCDRTLNSSRFRTETGLMPSSWPEMIDQYVADLPLYG